LRRRCWLLPTDISIKKDTRRWLDDNELARMLKADLPKILRAIYEGIARGLKSQANHETVELPVGLSMASAVRFVLRTGLVDREEFLSALQGSRETGAEISVGSRPINDAIITLVLRVKEFVGSAKDLLACILEDANGPGSSISRQQVAFLGDAANAVDDA
jgi:hypothetical protein